MLNNYKFVGLIHLVFPGATIVHMRRNPVDTCYSCYKQLFAPGAVNFAYDLDNLAAQYRAYRRVMAHWDQVLPGRVHAVDYERLIAAQEAVTAELLDACGLPWDDACMDFQRNARAVHTSSNVQVRRALYADSVERWRAYKDHLGPLLALVDD
jgi:hypothetical protein